MGQLDSTCGAPPRQVRRVLGGVAARAHARAVHAERRRQLREPQQRGVGARGDEAQEALLVLLAVALQVAFERQTLKPVFPLDRL
jgi:hypothetical protein